jgi:hypothetical protein
MINLITNKVLLDPLEQFDVFPLLPFVFYSPTNLTLIALVNFLVLVFLFYATNYPNQSHTTASSVLSGLIRGIHEMLANLAESNIRLTKQVYFPILYYIF